MTGLLFVVAVGLGAVMRHTVNRLGTGWRGTLALNVAGAFALGWLVASEPGPDVLTVFGTGFLGSLTTFSTFALEATEGPVGRRVAVVAATVVLGLAAAAAGWAIG